MSRPFFCLALLCSLSCGTVLGGEAKPEPKRYSLRYQFKAGETIRWMVSHRAKIEMSVSGTSQTTETASNSVKAWRVKQVKADGQATFEHLVESVEMRHKFSGRQEVRYNSKTDKTPPAGFENIAQSLGVTLSEVTVDSTGKTLRRQNREAKAAVQGDGQITIPLAPGPIAVGERWDFPMDIVVPLEGGGVKKVKAQQQFVLEEVKNGVASIHVATRILTPVDDPAVQAQLVQRESSGTVRFDLDAGRILTQQMDLDRKVVGFRGAASSLHYATRFTEELLEETVKTASHSPSEEKK